MAGWLQVLEQARALEDLQVEAGELRRQVRRPGQGGQAGLQVRGGGREGEACACACIVGMLGCMCMCMCCWHARVHVHVLLAC